MGNLTFRDKTRSLIIQMLTRQIIVDEARKWIDTRWVHQGRSPAGIDCAGLLVCVLSDLGLPVEDMAGYRRSPEGFRFREHIFNQTEYAAEPAPGHIALFRESRLPTHTGFFGERDGKLTLIHAYAPVGKVIEEVFDHDWPKLLVAVRRVVGVED